MALQKSNIELETETTKKALMHLAVDNNMTLQRFIESQLIAMGKHGVAYLDLWNENEALRSKLGQLVK